MSGHTVLGTNQHVLKFPRLPSISANHGYDSFAMRDLAGVTEGIRLSGRDTSSLPTAPQRLQSHPPSTQPPPQSVRYPETSHSSSVQSDHPPTPKAMRRHDTVSRTSSKATYQHLPSTQRESLPASSPVIQPPTPMTPRVRREQTMTPSARVDVQSATSVYSFGSMPDTQTSRSASASSASNVTPLNTSDSCPSTSVRPEPPTPSRLVSTPGAKKSKWYVVLVGRRTGIFDDW